MTGVSFSNSSHLSSVVSQIENASSKHTIKNDAQVRLSTSTNNEGVKIYEAKTKGSDSSFSALKLSRVVEKAGFHSSTLDAKVETHHAKLDNWHVFENLAKNELASGLHQAGRDASPATVESLLSSILQDVRGNKSFDAGEVRFGPLAQLSQAVTQEVEFQKGNNPIYDRHEVVVNEPLYTAVNKGAGNKEGAPIVERYTPSQKRAAEAKAQENQYSALNFGTAQTKQPGSVASDQTYGTLDQSQATPLWGNKVSDVNNQPIYANSKTESAVENSSDNSDVLLDEGQAIYGNLTEKGKPALMPKPALGDIPPVPPKRDASLR